VSIENTMKKKKGYSLLVEQERGTSKRRSHWCILSVNGRKPGKGEKRKEASDEDLEVRSGKKGGKRLEPEEKKALENKKKKKKQKSPEKQALNGGKRKKGEQCVPRGPPIGQEGTTKGNPKRGRIRKGKQKSSVERKGESGQVWGQRKAKREGKRTQGKEQVVRQGTDLGHWVPKKAKDLLGKKKKKKKQGEGEKSLSMGWGKGEHCSHEKRRGGRYK